MDISNLKLELQKLIREKNFNELSPEVVKAYELHRIADALERIERHLRPRYHVIDKEVK